MGPACVIAGAIASPHSQALVLLWLPLLLMHGIGPCLDKLLLGEQPLLTQDSVNHQQEVAASTWVPVAFAALHSVAWVLAGLAAGALTRAPTTTTISTSVVSQLCALAAGLGASMTLSMAVSHELIHRREGWQRAMGFWQLALAHFTGYARAHMHHHLHVGLSTDHSTARLGEPFGHFLPRYWWGTHEVAWREERAEAARRKRPLWGGSNNTLMGLLAQVATLGVSWCLGGGAALGVHLAAAALGVVNLAALDYLFHYGACRARKLDGSVAPVTASLSFNSAFPIENALLLRVLLHSSHHHAASKPYRLLGFSRPDVLAADARADHHQLQQHQHQHQHQHHQQQPHHPGEEESEGEGSMAPRFAYGWPLLLMGLAAFVPPLFLPLARPLSERANRAHRREVEALQL